MTVQSLIGARAVPAKSLGGTFSLDGKSEGKLLSPSFRFAEQCAQPLQKGWASSSCLAPDTKPCASSPVSLEPRKTLPLPSISNCSCLKLTGSELLLLSLPLVFILLFFFPKQKEKAESSRFLRSRQSQRAHFCPVERRWHPLGGVRAWIQPGSTRVRRASCLPLPAWQEQTGTKVKLQAWKGCLLQRFMATEHDQPSGLITKGERSMFLSADLQGYYLMKQICR